MIGIGLKLTRLAVGIRAALARANAYWYADGTTYGSLASDVIFTDAFSISIDFLTSDSSALLPALVSSDASGTSLYAAVETDTGLIRASVMGATLTVPTEVVNDNVYRNLVIARDEANLVTITTGSNSVSSTISGDITLRYVGSRGGTGRYFTGLLSNLLAYDGGDEATGTLVVDCKLDEYGSDEQTNLADSSNNITLSGVSQTLDWTQLQSNGDYLFVYNEWTYTGVSSTGDSATITSGSTYQLDTTSVAVIAATGAYSDSWAAGSYSEQFTAASTTLTLNADADDSSADVSLREVLNP